jgi:hypothetical protein
MFPVGRDGKVIQIRAAEDDAGAGGCGEEADFDRYAVVETDTADFDRALGCGFKLHLPNANARQLMQVAKYLKAKG